MDSASAVHMSGGMACCGVVTSNLFKYVRAWLAWELTTGQRGDVKFNCSTWCGVLVHMSEVPLSLSLVQPLKLNLMSIVLNNTTTRGSNGHFCISLLRHLSIILDDWFSLLPVLSTY